MAQSFSNHDKPDTCSLCRYQDSIEDEMRNLAASLHQLIQQVQILTQQGLPQPPTTCPTRSGTTAGCCCTHPQDPQLSMQRFTRESDKNIHSPMQRINQHSTQGVSDRQLRNIPHPQSFNRFHFQNGRFIESNDPIPILYNFPNFFNQAFLRHYLYTNSQTIYLPSSPKQLSHENIIIQAPCSQSWLDGARPKTIVQNGLNKTIAKQLIQKGIPHILQDLYLASITSET